MVRRVPPALWAGRTVICDSQAGATATQACVEVCARPTTVPFQGGTRGRPPGSDVMIVIMIMIISAAGIVHNYVHVGLSACPEQIDASDGKGLRGCWPKDCAEGDAPVHRGHQWQAAPLPLFPRAPCIAS